MIPHNQLKPVSGTFVAPIVNDTGTNSWGLKEWDANFRMIKAPGMDTIIVLGCEYQFDGIRQPALDPRNTTWPDDPNLLAMISGCATFMD